VSFTQLRRWFAQDDGPAGLLRQVADNQQNAGQWGAWWGGGRPYLAVFVDAEAGELVNIRRRSCLHGKLHFRHFLHCLRSAENFKADDPAVIIKIGNDAGSYFIAFLYASFAQRDNQGIGLAIINNFHDVRSRLISDNG
jgi:hypothetical protein